MVHPVKPDMTRLILVVTFIKTLLIDFLTLLLLKRDYEGSKVFITATSKEVDELIESGCEVIALDATKQKRPKETLEELVTYIRKHAPNVEIG